MAGIPGKYIYDDKGNIIGATGGKKAALTNKQKHGDDFYKNIGAIGGSNGHTGGFAANPDLARIAGRKGGLISRRKKSVA